MPTYRKLHVKTVESLDLNEMPDDFTRLLWVLLPLALCREGRGVYNFSWIKSKVFPLREDVSQTQIGVALGWLENRGMIVPYSVDNREYFYVPTFHKYQGNTQKEAKSDYPPPPDWSNPHSGPTPELVQSKSVSDADAATNANADANADAAADRFADDDALRLLAEFGVEGEPLAECAAADVSLIGAWITTAKRRGEALRNPQGFVVSGIRSGKPPGRSPPRDDDYSRFTDGEYASYIET